jgi:Sortase domain
MRKLCGVLATLLACAGIAMIVISQHTHRWAPPPVPPAAFARPLPLDHPAQAGSHPSIHLQPAPVTQLDADPLPRSMPQTVRIPAIGVDARIIALGMGYGDIVNVPSLSTPMLTSWFDGGVTPGQVGPAVLFGHVDSAVTGPAVFYRLGDLRPGDLIYVTRTDTRTAVFDVDAIDLYSQSSFPDQSIYGTTTSPVLRLVTCGGDFDTKTHLYLDRTVAWAKYVGQLH